MRIFMTLLSLFLLLNLNSQDRSELLTKATFQNANTPYALLKSDSLEVIYPGNWLNSENFLIYVTPGNGYVNGTNEYLDQAKVQVFKNEETYDVYGAYFWIGALDGNSGTIHFNLYDFEGEPSLILASTSITMQELQENVDFSELYWVPFDTPVRIEGDYAMGVSVIDAGQDLFSLVSSADGQGGGLDLAWEQWFDGRWYSYQDVNSWNYDLDLGVFPVICREEPVIIDDFAGGTGTPEDPFLIANAEQLNSIRKYPDKHYRQIQSIDLDIFLLNKSTGWNAIGTIEEAFSGSYDGDDYTISNLYIQKRNLDYQGLFGYCQNAEIRNVILSFPNIMGNRYVGSLTGVAEQTNISNIRVTGDVQGSVYTGGIIGFANDGTQLSEGHFQGLVKGQSYTGGIVGQLHSNATLSHCASLGTVEGSSHTAGLAGIINPKSPRSIISDDGVTISFPPASDFNGSMVDITTIDGNSIPRTGERLVSPAVELGVNNGVSQIITESYFEGERVPFYSIKFPVTEANLDAERLRVRVIIDEDNNKLPVFGKYDPDNNSYTINVMGLVNGWQMAVIEGTPVTSVVDNSKSLTNENTDYNWPTLDFKIIDDSKAGLNPLLTEDDIASEILPIARDILITYFNAGYKKPKLNVDNETTTYQVVLTNTDVPGQPGTAGASYYVAPGIVDNLGAVYIYYPGYISDYSTPSSWDFKFVLGHEIFHAVQAGYNYMFDEVITPAISTGKGSTATCYEEGTANLLGSTYKTFGNVLSGIDLLYGEDEMKLHTAYDDYLYNPYNKQDFFGFIAKRYYDSNLTFMDEMWIEIAKSWPTQNYDYTRLLDYYRSGLDNMLRQKGFTLPWVITEFALQRLIIHDEEYLLRESEKTDDSYTAYIVNSNLLVEGQKNNYRKWESNDDELIEYNPIRIEDVKSLTAAAVDFNIPPMLPDEARPDTLEFNISLSNNTPVQPLLDEEGMRIAVYRKSYGKLAENEPTLLLDKIDEPVKISIEDEITQLSFVFVNAMMERTSTTINLSLKGEGRVLNVNTNQKYETIQAAVDAAQDGHEILVLPGTYFEWVNLSSKSVTLRSSEGAENTILDGTGAQYGGGILAIPTKDLYLDISGFTFQNWEIGFGAQDLYGHTATINLSDCIFTKIDKAAIVYTKVDGIIKNNNIIGSGSEEHYDATVNLTGENQIRFEYNTIQGNKGSGINVSGTSVISNNIIKDNDTDHTGGGIEIDGGSPTIEYNTIINNIANVGGGIKVWDASPTIIHNTIDRNTARYDGGGISLGNTGDDYKVVVKNNIITNNKSGQNGGGIECFICDGNIDNNTITHNEAVRGGGMYFHNGRANWSNNTVRFNHATDVGGGVAGYNIPDWPRYVDDGNGKTVVHLVPCFTISNNVVNSNTHTNSFGAPGPGGYTCPDAGYNVYTY